MELHPHVDGCYTDLLSEFLKYDNLHACLTYTNNGHYKFPYAEFTWGHPVDNITTLLKYV